MSTTQELTRIAETYFRSWREKDFDTLGGLLAEDVTFRGPLGTADGAGECLAGLRGMAERMDDLVVEKIFVAGDADVLTWYELRMAGAPPLPTANWSQVADGRITRIRATFDPRPLFAQ